MRAQTVTSESNYRTIFMAYWLANGSSVLICVWIRFELPDRHPQKSSFPLTFKRNALEEHLRFAYLWIRHVVTWLRKQNSSTQWSVNEKQKHHESLVHLNLLSIRFTFFLLLYSRPSSVNTKDSMELFCASNLPLFVQRVRSSEPWNASDKQMKAHEAIVDISVLQAENAAESARHHLLWSCTCYQTERNCLHWLKHVELNEVSSLLMNGLSVDKEVPFSRKALPLTTFPLSQFLQAALLSRAGLLPGNSLMRSRSEQL